MRISLVAGLFCLGSAPLLAQASTEAAPAAPAPALVTAPGAASAPASATATIAPPAAPPEVQNSDVGFSYALPRDWEFVAPPPPPAAEPYPDLPPAAKKGNACVEIALTARHGSSPASVVVVVALPFGCFGQSIAPSALPGFASGVEEGFKESFELVDPVYGTYALGSHNLWIERSKGSPKGQPQAAYTFEIACTVLEKGAVCWMAMAADEDSLKTFEQQAVTLEGDSFGALAPMDRIQFEPVVKPQKPS